MAEYVVTAPDGKQITIEGPAGASQSEVIAQAQKLYQPQSSVEVSSSEGGQLNTQFASTEGGAAVGRPQGVDRTNVLPTPRPLESALAGATKSFVDPAIALAQMATRGNYGTSDLAKRLGQEADVYYQENPASYLTGRVAGAVAPASLTSKSIGMIPSFAKLNPYMQSAAFGATQGLLTPEETGKKDLDLLRSELTNVAGGAALGAPLPWLGKAANTIYGAGKAALEPFNQSGRNLILGRALRQFAGNDTEQAIQNLRNAKEFVPGSQPTVAEAAGVPSLAAMQRAALNASPETTNALAQRQAQNVAARTNALENIASPTRVAKYQDLRGRVAEELYADALKPLNLGELTPEMKKEVGALIKTPAIKRAMGQAKENAANRGIDIANPEGSMQGLHETKMALDDEIAKVKALAEKNGGSASAELKSLQAAKNRLLGFMEDVSPAYKTARVNYERLSKPVEQLEKIANIAEKSTRSTDYATYLNRFSNELEAAKKEGLLSDRQISRLQAIKDDLLRADFANTAGRGVGSNTMQNLAYNNMLQEVNLPNLLRRRGLAETAGNIGARVKDVAYGAANKRLTSEMADVLLDPRKAAALMRLAGMKPLEANVPTEQSALAKLLFTQGGINTLNALRGAGNE